MKIDTKDSTEQKDNLRHIWRKIFEVLRSMRKLNPNIFKGVTKYDERVFAFTKPKDPASTNNRDQCFFISDHILLMDFCKGHFKTLFAEFAKRAN